jgi:AmmeMemoRadiSam system protein B
MGYQDLKTSIEIGEAVYRAIKDLNAIILASSDLTHQESQESANLKDHLVIDAIEAMDEERLHKIVKENRVTTCGYGPVTSAIVASKKLYALKAKLLAYYTSGDIIGDYRNVVGYAAAKMTM